MKSADRNYAIILCRELYFFVAKGRKNAFFPKIAKAFLIIQNVQNLVQNVKNSINPSIFEHKNVKLFTCQN